MSDIRSQNPQKASSFVGFRDLAMGDDYGCGCQSLMVDTSLSIFRVARELDGLTIRRGRPSTNVTELASVSVLQWSQATGIERHYIQSGTPMQNGFIECFNDESLNEKLLSPLTSALYHITEWKEHYIASRQHSSQAISRPVNCNENCIAKQVARGQKSTDSKLRQCGQ